MPARKCLARLPAVSNLRDDSLFRQTKTMLCSRLKMAQAVSSLGMRRGNGSLSKRDGYLVQRFYNVTDRVHAVDGRLLVLIDRDVALRATSRAEAQGELGAHLAAQCRIDCIEAACRSVLQNRRTPVSSLAELVESVTDEYPSFAGRAARAG